MHEASLVQGLLKIVLEALAKHQKEHAGQTNARVTEIVCEAGLMACFEAETLKACFEIFAEGTAAENAKLKIDIAPLTCRCELCGCKFDLKERHFVCRQCGGEKISFSGGNGLTLLAINVENEDKANG